MTETIEVLLTGATNGGWQSTVTDAAARALADGGTAGTPWPLPLPPDGPGLAADEFEAALDRIDRNQAQPHDATAVGQHLLACLLPLERWGVLGPPAQPGETAGPIELVLHTTSDVVALQRLPWELLHDGRGFLAARGSPPITLRRVIGPALTATDSAEQLEVEPSVLVIIGGSLDDTTLRPAAEYLALFDTLRSGSVDFRTSLLLNANVDEIAERCAATKPSVVHIIAHGDQSGTGAGFVVLPAKNREDPPVQLHAQQLVSALQAGGGTPAVVVVTACRTAGGVSEFGFQPSLAAECVALGIPLVGAMTGAIASDACREFTYGFYSALLSSRNIVAAAAAGRRVAFLNTAIPDQALDWAYPAIFCGPGVDGTVEFRNPEVHAARARIARELLSLYPSPIPFCGRHDVLDAFDRLVGSPASTAPAALALVQAARYDTPDEMGSSRTLTQLAADATRSGYAACYWRDPARAYEFRSFARALSYEARQSASRLGTDIAGDSQTGILDDLPEYPQAKEHPTYPQLDAGLRQLIAEKLRSTHNPQAIAKALELDLVTVAEAVQAEGTGRGLVVFIEDLHKCGPAVPDFVTHAVTLYGLGNPGTRIPVVFTTTSVRDVDCADAVASIRAYLEGKKPTELWMTPFQPREAYLAYQQLLLGDQQPSVPATGDWQEVLDWMHTTVEGKPGRLRQLKQTLDAMRRFSVLRPATPAERLTDLIGDRP